LPAAVVEEPLAILLHNGNGEGQKLSPTSRTHRESDSRTIRLVWLRAGGERIIFVSGLHAVGVLDLGCRRAEDDPEGTAVFGAGRGGERRDRLFGCRKHLPDVRRTEGEGRTEANDKTQLRGIMDWKNRFIGSG